MSRRLTDREAVRRALFYAIEWEDSVIDSLRGSREGSDIATTKRCQRNIVAFKRVLDRHFNGERLPVPDAGKTISLTEILSREPQKFKGKWNPGDAEAQEGGNGGE